MTGIEIEYQKQEKKNNTIAKKIAAQEVYHWVVILRHTAVATCIACLVISMVTRFNKTWGLWASGFGACASLILLFYALKEKTRLEHKYGFAPKKQMKQF